jgi:hypothetical protein
MALPPNEFSIWIPGVPRSLQASLLRGYLDRIRTAARAVFPLPLLSDNIEIVLLFVDSGSRPDVDNVLKPALDALKGIVYVDDRQVRSVRSEAVPNDPALRTVNGSPHLTFSSLLDGGHFLIRVRVPGVPTIATELASS